MIYLFYLSIGAAFSCIVLLCVLKFIAISKMRIDNRDQRRKVKMSATEVLMLIKKLKPFPVGVHKGWKLHSFINDSQVWGQEISLDSSDISLDVYSAFSKMRIPAQILLQILKDVSKTSSWKPACLATSITFKPAESDAGSRSKGLMGSGPVQYDVVMEESSMETGSDQGTIQNLLAHLLSQNGTLQTVKKQLKRYWHREDNGVCWHLQMCEEDQEWLFFLAQPVEEVECCLLTVIGHSDKSSNQESAKYISEITSSLSQYILYRKQPCTPLLDIKLPTSKPDRISQQPDSSSDEGVYKKKGHGQGLFLRFRSMVEKPTFGAERLGSIKGKLIRSASILHHTSTAFSNSLNSSAQIKASSLKTSSLDRRLNMPDLKSCVAEDSNYSNGNSQSASLSHSSVPEEKESPVVNQDGSRSPDNNNEKMVKNVKSQKNDDDTSLGSSILDDDGDTKQTSVSSGKNMDKDLEEDVKDQEKYEETTENLLLRSGSKEDIKAVVYANHAAAELLAIALQVSNLDLSKSVEEQVITSGGWMFCGLENDVVVLKKISLKDNIHCYLGKGVIAASPLAVWNAVRNPRTRFTYDDSLKKVDVLETISDNIKVVYYYHEVLQLFKTESYDMLVTQSERVDREGKYLLSIQSTDRKTVSCPPGTLRVKVLPSGWIIEPVNKDKKVHSMVTYVMQIDFGAGYQVGDRTPSEDIISKQPMSISFLRQYLKGLSYPK